MDDFLKTLEAGSITVVAVVFGVIGAALGIAYTPEISRRQAVAAMVSGLVGAFIFAPLVLHLVKLNPAPMWAVAGLGFFFGVGGMFIVPLIVMFWSRLAKDPTGFIGKVLDFIEQMRGRRPPPPPPGATGGQS